MKYTLSLKSKVPHSSDGFALLDEVCRRFTYHDKNYWKEKLEQREVLVNGAKAHADLILHKGDEIEFIIPNFEEPDIDTAYTKIWENNHLILVSKPSGLPVHSTKRFYLQTMTSVLRKQENNVALNPLHRLDRETSGLMFYVKTKYAHKRFQKNFQHFLAGKYYLCIARGSINEKEFVVNVCLEEAKKPPVNYKMCSSQSGQEAETIFYKIAESNGYSLLIAKLNTGRKHQIRAHLEYLSHPIVGDKLYSFGAKYFIKRCKDELQEADIKILGSNNQLLHSFAVKVNLPGENLPKLFYSFNMSQEFKDWLTLFPEWQEDAVNLIERIAANKKEAFPKEDFLK